MIKMKNINNEIGKVQTQQLFSVLKKLLFLDIALVILCNEINFR
jgi:hypothetical protein